MWFKHYRDYKRDEPLIKEQVSPSKGIIGCEMHEINGWGDTIPMPVKKRKRGLIATILYQILGGPEHHG